MQFILRWAMLDRRAVLTGLKLKASAYLMNWYKGLHTDREPSVLDVCRDVCCVFLVLRDFAVYSQRIV